jgi:hypothetical protein
MTGHKEKWELIKFVIQQADLCLIALHPDIGAPVELLTEIGNYLRVVIPVAATSIFQAGNLELTD